LAAAAIPLLSALIAGCLHALEMDHMTAVTAFVSRRPHPLRAFGFGVRWGLGHSLAILLAGGALVALGLRPPEKLVTGLEAAVGVMLIALGAWVVWGVMQRRGRSDEQGAGGAAEARRHQHGTTWVGAAHGLAGTAGFLALLPATLLATPLLAGAYLALFGIGTMLAMGLYAAGAGLVFQRIAGGAPRVAAALKVATGTAGIVVGVAWLIGAA
jgi:nickel/cobalt transporter (NicO) family protein